MGNEETLVTLRRQCDEALKVSVREAVSQYVRKSGGFRPSEIQIKWVSRYPDCDEEVWIDSIRVVLE
jgi:hypothetical protein